MNTEIQKALEVLRKGGIILYPTDTVWGIGCDATDPEAVAKVYEIKKRADSKSLVLLASDMDMICRYVKEVPEMAVQLVEVNDKPMTIIYPDAVAGEAGCMKADRRCLAFNTVAEDGTVYKWSFPFFDMEMFLDSLDSALLDSSGDERTMYEFNLTICNSLKEKMQKIPFVIIYKPIFPET